MVKIGILGAGSFVQRRILPILSKIESIQPTCLFNRNIEKAKEIAAKFHIPYAVASREELINHPEVEAIFIASPNCCHEEDAIACASSGKPVLCEKPLAPTVAAIQRMQAAFSNSSGQLFVGQSLRFKPAIQTAKQLLANGEIGGLLNVRAYFTLPVPKDNWRYKKSYGGGALQDIGVHLVDLIRFITSDEIASVFAQGDSEECESSAMALGKLRSGANFTLECSMDQPLRSGFELIGTKGRLVSVGSLRQTYDPGESLSLIREDDSITSLPLKANDIYEAEFIHFAALVRGEATSMIDAHEGLSNQLVIEAIYASMASNLPREMYDNGHEFLEMS